MAARRTWKGWTTGELDRLEELRLAGLTAGEIAAELGRTLGSVRNRLTIESLARVWPSREKWAAILTGPHTLKGAAAQMGTTVWAVKRAKGKLRKAGFDCPSATRADGAAPRG